MRKLCFIIGAAPFRGFTLPALPSDLVIAADAGFTRLFDLGVTGDLAVGDFDSLGAPPPGLPVLSVPAEKDETDALLAVREGMRRGYDAFVLLGCAAGRLDHTLANIQLLTFLAESGMRGLLLGDHFAATVIRDAALDFPAGLSGGLSVFCLGERAEGVTLTGLQYPLSKAELSYDFPLGVSNAFTGRPARVEVESGTLLVYWEMDPAQSVAFFRDFA